MTPPPRFLDGLQNTPKARLLNDSKLVAGSLDYQWARATMILESLKRRDGSASPLGRATFDPFEADYETIRQKYRVLEAEIDKIRDERARTRNEKGRGGSSIALARKEMQLAEREEEVGGSVNKFLRLLYAYLSWGIRQKAKSEKEVDRILEDLGFHIPTIGSQRVFDAVVPAALCIAAITFLFWIVYDWAFGSSQAS